MNITYKNNNCNNIIISIKNQLGHSIDESIKNFFHDFDMIENKKFNIIDIHIISVTEINFRVLVFYNFE